MPTTIKSKSQSYPINETPSFIEHVVRFLQIVEGQNQIPGYTSSGLCWWSTKKHQGLTPLGAILMSWWSSNPAAVKKKQLRVATHPILQSLVSSKIPPGSGRFTPPMSVDEWGSSVTLLRFTVPFQLFQESGDLCFLRGLGKKSTGIDGFFPWFVGRFNWK